ncbi:MAG: radical SAM protein [Magnetospirillum gryphiswaldense]|nr:radical SAM protein [Magnetospirillum gryphiswaldense]
MRACFVSFNGLGHPGAHTPPQAMLALEPIFEEYGIQCEMLDAPLLCREAQRDSAEGLVDHIASSACVYDLVAVTTRCETYPIALAFAARLKALNPSAVVVFGGPQASATARATIARFHAVDMVIRGEGESPLRALLETISSGQDLQTVPSLTFRTPDGKVHETSPAPQLECWSARPFPAYQRYANRYRAHRLKFSEIELGRGCPFACNFCFTAEMWRRQYRLRPFEQVASEMRYLRDVFGQHRFHLIHDNFIMLPASKMQALIDAFSELPRDVAWGVSSRIDTIALGELRALANVGLREIFVGIETGNDTKKAEIGKHWTLQACERVIDACSEANIAVTTSFIVGFPGENLDELTQTVAFAAACSGRSDLVETQLHAFALEAGTPLHEPHLANLSLSGRKGDHIRIPWDLDAKQFDIIGQNADIFSTFMQLYNPTLEDAPYAVQDVLGPALNYFRHTLRSLFAAGLSHKAAIAMAVEVYDQGPAGRSRLTLAHELVCRLARSYGGPEAHRAMAFEQICAHLDDGEFSAAHEALDFQMHDIGPIAAPGVLMFSANFDITVRVARAHNNCTYLRQACMSGYRLVRLTALQRRALYQLARGVSLDDVVKSAGRLRVKDLHFEARVRRHLQDLGDAGLIDLRPVSGN